MAPAVDETMLMRILVVLRSAGVLVVTLPGGSPLNCCQESIVHDENPSFWVSVGSDIVTVGDLASFWYFLVVKEQHMVLMPLMLGSVISKASEVAHKPVWGLLIAWKLREGQS